MHFMSESASTSLREQKRWETSQRITLCAQRLTDEHGLDGFTMDELAQAAEVSRRTLFNYFPSKLDAVLGAEEPPDPSVYEPFAAGGPTGELLGDLREMVTRFLAAEEADADTVARMRRLLRSDPRLFQAAHTRFESAAEQFADLIAAREGDAVAPRRARIVARLLLTMFDLALDAFLDDPDRDLAEHFGETLDAAHDLLG
jgi:AcrR family transcriptional regulator